VIFWLFDRLWWWLMDQLFGFGEFESNPQFHTQGD
jgi:hypothetical protein